MRVSVKMERTPITGKEYFTLTRFVERTIASALAPAFPEERIVFGAQMPGYGARSIPESVVMRWIGIMKEKSIQRVCCLLPPSQLGYYVVDLLGVYAREFGEKNVFCEVESSPNILFPWSNYIINIGVR